MEHPSRLTGAEICKTLQRMGLNLIYQAGPFCVYADQKNGKRVLLIPDEWDTPAKDIERNLQTNGFVIAKFWECYELLYTKTKATSEATNDGKNTVSEARPKTPRKH